MIRTAIIDDSGLYRYRLGREWDPLFPKRCCFIMLNPSIADASVDDPTIRRCIGFAKAWGFGSLGVLNLFAYRSTDPKAIRLVADPVGPENDKYIAREIRDDACGLVVAAWGNGGMIHNRARAVVERFGKMMLCLGKTEVGHPRHPLYVPAKAKLVPLTAPASAGEEGS